MQRRHPIPRLWLVTDERQGEALWPALERLPRGAGILFRLYRAPDRERLLRRVDKIARRRGLVLLVSRGRGQGAASRRGGVAAASAHNLRELRAAEASGADLVFLSPVFPTRSHPGARTLGPVRFGLLARQTWLPVIALGGMNARRFRRVKALGACGWAGIDAFGA